MAIAYTENQYVYKGKGPLDAKSLVKTYAELTKSSTWQAEDGTFIAYNGMTVAVWLNNADTTKNGIYVLHDSAVTSTRGQQPDVTKETNWHKLVKTSDLAAFTTELTNSISKVATDIQQLDEKVDNLVKQDLVTADSLDTKLSDYATKSDLENYATVDYVDNISIGDMLREIIMFGGDADPTDDN